MTTCAFDQAIARVHTSLRDVLLSVPDSLKQSASEVRLRVGQPLSITAGDRPVFVMPGGRIAYSPGPGCLRVTSDALYETFRALCDYSVHAHQKAINAGFIPLPGGHRAGISGMAVAEDSLISNVRDISSINIRIARSVPGEGASVAGRFMRGGGSLIIAGPPGSGKTTLLRETVRLLSSGELGRHYNIAVVDERLEIGGALSGVAQFDLGCCTDLLSGYPKAAGVIAALRALSPHIIAFDEIGDTHECEAVAEGINSGVRFILTMHVGSREEVLRRPVSRMLLDTGAFPEVILLSAEGGAGHIKEVVRPYDSVYKDGGSGADVFKLRAGGH